MHEVSFMRTGGCAAALWPRGTTMWESQNCFCGHHKCTPFCGDLAVTPSGGDTSRRHCDAVVETTLLLLWPGSLVPCVQVSIGTTASKIPLCSGSQATGGRARTCGPPASGVTCPFTHCHALLHRGWRRLWLPAAPRSTIFAEAKHTKTPPTRHHPQSSPQAPRLTPNSLAKEQQNTCGVRGIMGRVVEGCSLSRCRIGTQIESCG